MSNKTGKAEGRRIVTQEHSQECPYHKRWENVESGLLDAGGATD